MLVAPLILGHFFALAPVVTQEIPLDKVWAYGMPRTMKVRELESKQVEGLPEEQFIKSSKTTQILQLLSHRNLPREGTQAGPAILVEGERAEALANAARGVIEEGRCGRSVVALVSG